MKTAGKMTLVLGIFILITSAALAGEGSGRKSPPILPVIGLVDDALELFPDQVQPHPLKKLVVHAPRNSIAGVHVLITGLKGTERISFGESEGTASGGALWYRLIDVPVAENTGLDRNTEKYSGMKNPFVIRRAPFRIYDPFRAVASPIHADSTVVALRVEFPIAATTPVGVSRHRLLITVNNRRDSVEFTVIVHRATLPPVSQMHLAYINWHSIDNICSAHEVQKWSEPFWSMLARYARMMTRGRQNAFWFIWGDYFTFDSTGNVTAFASDRFERYIRVFLDAGMATIEGAPMVGRRLWGSNDMVLGVRAADGKEVDAMSERGKRMLTQMAQRITAVMRDNRWENRWLQGVFDEPEDVFVDRYRELATLLRVVKPDLRILEATLTTNATGVINVWCPQVHQYQLHRSFYDQRRAAGDDVWVYTCLSPGGLWLNRLLDEERLRQVYIGWALAKYDLQGYLHWGGNFHTAKPFEELVRFHMEGQFLPAGDSHILYPVHDGPLSSHRFEAHRMGMEDGELLEQLKEHDRPRVDEIITRVVRGFDTYTKDVRAYREARKLLLEAVDQYSPE